MFPVRLLKEEKRKGEEKNSNTRSNYPRIHLPLLLPGLTRLGPRIETPPPVRGSSIFHHRLRLTTTEKPTHPPTSLDLQPRGGGFPMLVSSVGDQGRFRSLNLFLRYTGTGSCGGIVRGLIRGGIRRIVSWRERGDDEKFLFLFR